MTVSEFALALTELGSSGAVEKTYAVALAADPTADVTITVANGDPTAVEVDADSGAPGNQNTLTFTHGSSGNWATAQTVTVRALNDADADNESFDITHSASAANGPYDGVVIDTVEVTTTDAGHGIVVSESSLSVAENGGEAAYAIVLNSQPSHDVMVTVVSENPEAATVNTADGTAGATQTLTFSASGSNSWNTAQTITVVGVDDDNDNPGDSRSSTISHAISSLDANYNGLDVPDATVTVVDDDAADETGATPPPPPLPPPPPSPPTLATSEIALSVSPNPVTEGEEITVTVASSQLVSSVVTIPLVLTAGAAEAGDYGALNAIVIEANQLNGTGVIATAKDDDLDDETFTVALGSLPAGLVAGTPASVEVAIADDTDVTSTESPADELPAAFALEQNYPNPFNPSTEIAYELPAPEYVRLEVFDRTGRRVALLVDGVRSAGLHTIRFEASGLPSGLYAYRMQAGGTTLVRKMTLVR